ncbi:MAG TPA: aspartate--tRNA ligase [Bacteroidales bacterium]|nr:aspartate--tRNA ligase [Bacteroidales bacterium]
MLRTHTCGELRISDVNKEVKLSGWIQRIRDKGAMIWIDLRDRYGITQLVFYREECPKDLLDVVYTLGREFVIQVIGKVVERESKNSKIPTGDIEIKVSSLNILNKSLVPPFTIEDETDGGDELRMKYRYLDLRRNTVKEKIELRHRLAQATREYLDKHNFLEIETPFLIKSTPEGARDFIVPSRIHAGEFYALPQSPQTFKQLLMVSGFDRYFQIVRCFRDEDLRADRQPEFTQIDCELSFVEQEDILQIFEGLIRFLFKKEKNIDFTTFPRMTYAEAMQKYGSDKPDIRFGMEFNDVSTLVKGKGFKVFDDAEVVLAINAEGCNSYTRKQIDELTDFVKRPQIGAGGLIYIRYQEDNTLKSSVDKFYTPDDLKVIADSCRAKSGDLILILVGKKKQTYKAMNELRLEMGNRMGLRNPEVYAPLWVIDFPLLEWDEETKRFYAMHHPFTSPKPEDISMLESNPGQVRANAYDLVINGVEIGGGSIRIHSRDVQKQMFNVLGFSDDEAQKQFGFLLGAFEFGAPPHGGIALGFDRLCAMFGGTESIRDYIAFPKNQAARDMMIDAPSTVDENQLKELNISINIPKE